MKDPYNGIRQSLKTLKLKEIDRLLDEIMAHAMAKKLPVSSVLEQLFAAEAAALIERRIERKIKESKLPERKLLANFDFDFQTGVDKQQIMELATLSFVAKKQGVILAGSSGTGNYAKFLVM
jgi:DNA replication protein DnaC